MAEVQNIAKSKEDIDQIKDVSTSLNACLILIRIF